MKQKVEGGGITFEKTGEETSRERGKDKTRKIKM